MKWPRPKGLSEMSRNKVHYHLPQVVTPESKIVTDNQIPSRSLKLTDRGSRLGSFGEKD